MTPSHQIIDLYACPNGDRWLLERRTGGKLVVCHYPNQASGGAFSETDVDVFLRHKPYGPEHQALVTVLATLDQSTEDPPAARPGGLTRRVRLDPGLNVEGGVGGPTSARQLA
jgi:hypothetical protein